MTDDELGIEMYDNGRFFTITGKVYGEARPVLEHTKEAREVYTKYFQISE